MKFYLTILLAGIVQMNGTALAQSPEPPPIAERPPVVQADPKACAPGERSTLGGSGGPPEIQQQGRENLGEKLARTDGVICPPNDIDPDIQAPPIGGGVTPVIPPPGSPGGDPSVRPK